MDLQTQAQELRLKSLPTEPEGALPGAAYTHSEYHSLKDSLHSQLLSRIDLNVMGSMKPERLREGFRQQRLAQARHPFQQDVPAGEKRHKQPLHHVGLADFGLVMSFFGIGQLGGMLTGRWQSVLDARRAGVGRLASIALVIRSQDQG